MLPISDRPALGLTTYDAKTRPEASLRRDHDTPSVTPGTVIRLAAPYRRRYPSHYGVGRQPGETVRLGSQRARAWRRTSVALPPPHVHSQHTGWAEHLDRGTTRSWANPARGVGRGGAPGHRADVADTVRVLVGRRCPQGDTPDDLYAGDDEGDQDKRAQPAGREGGSNQHEHEQRDRGEAVGRRATLQDRL